MTRHDQKPRQAMPWQNQEAVERFWSRIDKRGDDECWPWLGSLHGRDRGRIMVAGIRYPAPALGWMLRHRQLFPDGMDACHSCDNPCCVNPSHIWPGTHQQNMADCVAKGRARKNPDASAATKLARPICKNGHPESAATFWGKNKVRRCKECVNEYDRARRAELRLTK